MSTENSPGLLIPQTESPSSGFKTTSRWSVSVFRFVVVGFAVLLTGTAGNSQTFTRVVDAGNPVTTDLSTTQYTGCAWFDYDNDGLLDLIVTNFGGSFLYHNEGGGNFTSVAGNPFASDPASYRGVSCADYDNDGYEDCFIVGQNLGSLYRNDGGTFVRVSDAALGSTDNRGWSPAWGDYDNDGNLDMFITFPNGFMPAPARSNRLLHSLGPPDYNFEVIDTGDVTMYFKPFTSGNWSDFDQDGDLDLFIGTGPASSFAGPDYIFQNMLIENGVPGFQFYSTPPLATKLTDGQVWNLIDYDNDGDFDAHRTSWGAGGVSVTFQRNDLFRHDADTFITITTGNMVTDQFISLSALWEDFDNDGDLDCFVTNVFSVDNFYRNNGDGTFTSITAGDAASTTNNHMGGGAADYDNDGDVDIFAFGDGLTQRSLLRNETNNGNSWLGVRLVGDSSNASGIGAKIRIVATLNGNPVQQLREISAQNTFLGHSSIIAHFGLLDAVTVDSLKVMWPSGIVFDTVGVTANQVLTLVEHCSDIDLDGVSCDDNCPFTSNTAQLDSDSDGVGDACDPCPFDPDDDADQDGFCADQDNCPSLANPDQADSNNDGIGDACCCQGTVGDANCSGDDTPTVGDISTIIDFLFISGNPLCCLREADTNQSGGGVPTGADITVSDIAVLINHLFITGSPLMNCP